MMRLMSVRFLDAAFWFTYTLLWWQTMFSHPVWYIRLLLLFMMSLFLALIPEEYRNSYAIQSKKKNIWLVGKKKSSEAILFVLLIFGVPIVFFVIKVISWTRI